MPSEEALKLATLILDVAGIIADIGVFPTANYADLAAYVEDIRARLVIILADVTGLAGEAMRGTDLALLAADKGDVWDELLVNHTTARSFAELLTRAMGDRYYFYEHFDGLSLGDLKVPYTTTIDTAGSIEVAVSGLPSAVRIRTDSNDNDEAILESDRTFSLATLGLNTLVMELRLKFSSEDDIMFRIGFQALVGGQNVVWMYCDTDSGAPANNDGGLFTEVDGGGSNVVDGDLRSGFDLTVYNVFRLEFEPGDEARLYVNDVLKATQAVDVNVPADQPFIVRLAMRTRTTTVKDLDVDYVKVWSKL